MQSGAPETCISHAAIATPESRRYMGGEFCSSVRKSAGAFEHRYLITTFSKYTENQNFDQIQNFTRFHENFAQFSGVQTSNTWITSPPNLLKFYGILKSF